MELRYRTTDEAARILIVHPNRSRLGLSARRLADAGFRVTTAESGSAALALLYRLPVDMVLAELDMANMSGADLARAMRGEIQWNDVPIMLITGKSQPRGAVRAYDAGADDVVVKPFNFDVLFARIQRRIQQARSVRRLREDNAALDARVVKRAIEIGELRDQLRQVQSNASREFQRSAVLVA